MNMNYFIPVESVSDFDKGRGENANVVSVDGIVENGLIVDQLLDKLRFLGLSIVLVD